MDRQPPVSSKSEWDINHSFANNRLRTVPKNKLGHNSSGGLKYASLGGLRRRIGKVC